VKLSQSSRIGLVTIVFLTIFTVGIGSVTVRHSRDEEIKKVDYSLNFIAQSALNNPDQTVGASLYAIEQSTIDATLALLTDDGSETIINESSLDYTGAPNVTLVKRATFAPHRSERRKSLSPQNSAAARRGLHHHRAKYCRYQQDFCIKCALLGARYALA